MNPANGGFAVEVTKLTALGRYGQADEVAGMVSYLASLEAAFVTGASLKIDVDPVDYKSAFHWRMIP